MVFVGLDVEQAVLLASQLRSWDTVIERIVQTVHVAEEAADIVVEATGRLLQIADDGIDMATRIDHAIDRVSSYQLRLTEHGFVALGFTERDDFAGPPGWEGYVANLMRAEAPGRIDELRAEIERDTAAGRDPSPKFKELHALLSLLPGSTTTIAVPGALEARVATSMSLVMSGVSAVELVDGPEQFLDQVATAMALGLSPAASGLPVGAFPADYVRWHERSDQIAEMRDELGLRSAALGAFDDLSIRVARLGTVREQVEALGLSDEARDRLIVWFETNMEGQSIDKPFPAEAVLRSSMADLVAEYKALVAEQEAVAVTTLHGAVSIDADGRLGAFDAIGATAQMLPQLPMAFLGRAYAREYREFELDDVETAMGLIGQDPATATAFFDMLGPQATAAFLSDLRLDVEYLSDFGDSPWSTDVARDLSIALGVASPFLPTEYASDIIDTRSHSGEMAIADLEPEWLFAYGDFAPGFLIAGAARSIGYQLPVHAASPFDLTSRRGDVRAPLLDRVLESKLAAELITELDRHGLLVQVLFAAEPPPTDLFYATVGRTQPDLPVITSLLMQAGFDDDASRLLIASAGSKLGDLHIDVANGLSQVLAGQVANTVGAGESDAYFDAVQNIFAAGAGIDIRIATAQYLDAALDDGFNQANEQWWAGLSQIGLFAGRIEGRDWIVHANDARARDRSIENANAWITSVSAVAGIALGAVSLVAAPASGGASLTVAGMLVTAGGTLSVGDADRWERHLEATRTQGLQVHVAGSAAILLSLLRTNSIVVPGGSVSLGSTSTGPVVVIERDDGMRTQVSISARNPGWATAAQAHLQLAGATVTVDSANGAEPVADIIAMVNSPLSGGYEAALRDAVAQGG